MTLRKISQLKIFYHLFDNLAMFQNRWTQLISYADSFTSRYNLVNIRASEIRVMQGPCAAKLYTIKLNLSK